MMSDHDHYGEYAEERHRHYDLEREDETAQRDIRRLQEDVRELRAELDSVLSRIRELEGSTPEARQARYEADVAAADLAESGYDRHGRDCQCSYCIDEPDTGEHDPGPDAEPPGPGVRCPGCGALPEEQHREECSERDPRPVYGGMPGPVTVYGPHCSHDECSWITCDESGLVEFCCRKPGCPHCGGLRNEPEDWASDPARFAAMPPGVQARVRAYWERYPLVRRSPDDSADRLDHSGPEPDDYDPGPEVDDEGGMSEYRYVLPEDYGRGQS